MDLDHKSGNCDEPIRESIRSRSDDSTVSTDSTKKEDEAHNKGWSECEEEEEEVDEGPSKKRACTVQNGHKLQDHFVTGVC